MPDYTPLNQFKILRTPEATLQAWARVLDYWFSHLDTGYSVRLGALSIKSSNIDWGSGTDQIDATDIPIQDSTPTGIYTATQVNAALLEAMTLLLTHATRHNVGGDDELTFPAPTKVQIEAVLTGELTSHTHASLVTKVNIEAVLTGIISSHSHTAIYYEPLVNGDPASPEIMFDDDGDIIMVEV